MDDQVVFVNSLANVVVDYLSVLDSQHHVAGVVDPSCAVACLLFSPVYAAPIRIQSTYGRGLPNLDGSGLIRIAFPSTQYPKRVNPDSTQVQRIV